MILKLLTEAPLALLPLLLSCEASYEEIWDTRFLKLSALLFWTIYSL